MIYNVITNVPLYVEDRRILDYQFYVKDEVFINLIFLTFDLIKHMSCCSNNSSVLSWENKNLLFGQYIL